MSRHAKKKKAVNMEEPESDANEGYETETESAASTTVTEPALSADRLEASAPKKRHRPSQRQRRSQRRRLTQTPAQTPVQTDPVPQPRLDQTNPLPEPRAPPTSNITQGNLGVRAPRWTEPRSSLPTDVRPTSLFARALATTNQMTEIPAPQVLHLINSLDRARQAIAADAVARRVLSYSFVPAAEREQLISILTPAQHRPGWIQRVVADIGSDLIRRDAVLDALFYPQNLEYLSRLLDSLERDSAEVELYRALAEDLFSPNSL